ncbi:MAG: hypothetical protein INR68_12620 [Methylobacterium mesophilicum]|nr:hypothetical protein [Methylobacterium mesophilicum]
MTLYVSLQHIASEWWAARKAARTEWLVSGLPVEIQKDIGWPDGTHGARRIGRRQSGPFH